MTETPAVASTAPKISFLFITVGSTLFQNLTSTILAPAVLNALASEGLARLTVQYGSATFTVPEGDVRDLDEEGDNARFRWVHEGKKLTVVVYRYTNHFERVIKEADAVISHAGSGTILSVLRAGKPLLVVPNTGLMDNHQMELADVLEEERYLEVCSYKQLAQQLPSFLIRARVGFRPFPAIQQDRFPSILDETMGFASA